MDVNVPGHVGARNLGTSSFVTFGVCTPFLESSPPKARMPQGRQRDIGSLLLCSPHRQIPTVSNHMTVCRMVEAYVGISNVFFPSPCMNEKTCNYKEEEAPPRSQKPFLVSFWSQASLIYRVFCTYPSCSRLSDKLTSAVTSILDIALIFYPVDIFRQLVTDCIISSN